MFHKNQSSTELLNTVALERRPAIIFGSGTASAEGMAVYERRARGAEIVLRKVHCTSAVSVAKKHVDFTIEAIDDLLGLWRFTTLRPLRARTSRSYI